MRQERITRQPVKRRRTRVEHPQPQALRPCGGGSGDADLFEAEQLVERIEALLDAAAA